MSYINKKIATIDKSILDIEKEIELITEYRTRFISDVVTGKIDVRNIAINEAISEDSGITEFEDEEDDYTEEVLRSEEDGE